MKIKVDEEIFAELLKGKRAERYLEEKWSKSSR